MAVIETKFGIGDVVWHATTTTETRHHPCPDCNGSREWRAISPAGGEFAFACPRCAGSYQGNRDLNLAYQWWIPSARKLTVGQVRAYSGPNGKNEYMCLETGIGSGSLYYEDRLFATETEALACAQAMANVENANPKGWVAKQYAATLRVCDYELKDAAMKAAVDSARRSQWRIGYLIDDLENAESLDEIRDLIDGWRGRERDDQDVALPEEAA